MATARIQNLGRTFLACRGNLGRRSFVFGLTVRLSSRSIVSGGKIPSSSISKTTRPTFATHSLVTRWNDTSLTAVGKSSVSFSSLPKRYQKRDDETEEEYELRVKELRMEDANKKYQTLLQQASAEESEPSGVQQQTLCEAMEQLRQAYEDLFYWDKAIEIEEKLLKMHETTLASKPLTTTTIDEEEELQRKVAASLVKLGDLNSEMGSNFVEARRYYKQALDIYNRIHRTRQSQKEAQQQAAIKDPPSASSTSSLSPSMINPPMHADMGQVLHSVAMTFARQEEFEKATAMLRQAKEHFEYHGLPLPIDEHDNVPEGHKAHPGIFQVFEDHALIYRMMERYEMALSVYQEARSYATELQVEPDLEFWTDLDMNMADCQLALGHSERALYTYQALLDKAVTRRSKAKDNNQGDDEDAMSLESVMRHNIGHVRAKEGRYQEALEEFTKSYNLKKQITKSETHPELINTLHGMGAVNATLGNNAEARGHFREALTIARLHADPALGDNDPKVSYALRNLEQVQKDRPRQAF